MEGEKRKRKNLIRQRAFPTHISITIVATLHITFVSG